MRTIYNDSHRLKNLQSWSDCCGWPRIAYIKFEIPATKWFNSRSSFGASFSRKALIINIWLENGGDGIPNSVTYVLFLSGCRQNLQNLYPAALNRMDSVEEALCQNQSEILPLPAKTHSAVNGSFANRSKLSAS